MHKLTFGLLGAGARGLVFAKHIRRCGDELAVAFDPDEERVKHFSRISGFDLSRAVEARAVFSDRSLDAVIIASPDVDHAAQLELALASSQNVYCEKPLATNIAALHRLWDIAPAAPQRVFVSGFVLRFHPFYRELIKLARELGRLHLVEANDLLPGAFYFRRWHRLRKYSGGLMCHEGVHTFDVVRQIVGGRAAKVSAQGWLAHYQANPAVGEVCGDCVAAPTCPDFFDLRTDPLFDLYQTPTRQMGFPRDLCVFNSEKDVVDSAAANVEFAAGPVFTYSLSLTALRRTRLFRLIGENGMVEGDEAESKLRVTMRKGGKMREQRIETPSTLFGGSDDECFDYFRTAVAESRPEIDLYQGALESNALVLAAELSMREGGRTVAVNRGRILQAKAAV